MNFDIKSMKLYNGETNEEVMDITDGFSSTDYTSFNIDHNIIPMRLDSTTSIEFNSENCFISEGFEKLFNQKIEQAFEVEMDIPQYVQARKHKNKRINKKWMKRHGLKIIYKKRRARVINIKTEDYPKDYSENITFEMDIKLI